MDRSKLLTFGGIALVIVLYVGIRLKMDGGSAPPAPAPAEVANTAESTAAPDANAPGTLNGADTPATSGKLVKQDLKVGTGAEAKTGQTVSEHYRGTLTNGTKFDASYDRGEPFSFPLGGGRVIKGWDEGVVGMKVGGRRKLIIPSDMGYGPSGSPPKIPPDATLVFEIELLEVG